MRYLKGRKQFLIQRKNLSIEQVQVKETFKYVDDKYEIIKEGTGGSNYDSDMGDVSFNQSLLGQLFGFIGKKITGAIDDKAIKGLVTNLKLEMDKLLLRKTLDSDVLGPQVRKKQIYLLMVELIEMVNNKKHPEGEYLNKLDNSVNDIGEQLKYGSEAFEEATQDDNLRKAGLDKVAGEFADKFNRFKSKFEELKGLDDDAIKAQLAELKGEGEKVVADSSEDQPSLQAEAEAEPVEESLIFEELDKAQADVEQPQQGQEGQGQEGQQPQGQKGQGQKGQGQKGQGQEDQGQEDQGQEDKVDDISTLLTKYNNILEESPQKTSDEDKQNLGMKIKSLYSNLEENETEKYKKAMVKLGLLGGKSQSKYKEGDFVFYVNLDKKGQLDSIMRAKVTGEKGQQTAGEGQLHVTRGTGGGYAIQIKNIVNAPEDTKALSPGQKIVYKLEDGEDGEAQISKEQEEPGKLTITNKEKGNFPVIYNEIESIDGEETNTNLPALVVNTKQESTEITKIKGFIGGGSGGGGGDTGTGGEEDKGDMLLLFTAYINDHFEVKNGDIDKNEKYKSYYTEANKDLSEEEIKQAINKQDDANATEQMEESGFSPFQVLKIFKKAQGIYSIESDEYTDMKSKDDKKVGGGALTQRFKDYEKVGSGDRYNNKKKYSRWHDAVMDLLSEYNPAGAGRGKKVVKAGDKESDLGQEIKKESKSYKESALINEISNPFKKKAKEEAPTESKVAYISKDIIEFISQMVGLSNYNAEANKLIKAHFGLEPPKGDGGDTGTDNEVGSEADDNKQAIGFVKQGKLQLTKGKFEDKAFAFTGKSDGSTGDKTQLIKPGTRNFFCYWLQSKQIKIDGGKNTFVLCKFNIGNPSFLNNYHPDIELDPEESDLEFNNSSETIYIGVFENPKQLKSGESIKMYFSAYPLSGNNGGKVKTPTVMEIDVKQVFTLDGKDEKSQIVFKNLKGYEKEAVSKKIESNPKDKWIAPKKFEDLFNQFTQHMK